MKNEKNTKLSALYWNALLIIRWSSNQVTLGGGLPPTVEHSKVILFPTLNISLSFNNVILGLSAGSEIVHIFFCLYFCTELIELRINNLILVIDHYDAIIDDQHQPY